MDFQIFYNFALLWISDLNSNNHNNSTNDLIVSADGSGNKAEGLDTKTSYGEGRVVENNTTYIQEVEVPA